MHEIGKFDRKGSLDPTRVRGIRGGLAGALQIVQLRKRGIDKVVLAGMSANLCVEFHMRELLEQGFELAVVKDATAGAKVPEGDAYATALVNFRYLANAVMTTKDVVEAMEQTSRGEITRTKKIQGCPSAWGVRFCVAHQL